MEKFSRIAYLWGMGLFFAFLASLFASASNLCMRRSIDAGGSNKAFVLIQMSIACVVATLLGPVKANAYACNAPILYLGLFSGVILAMLLYTIGRALLAGPAGLTFAILSASTVMPAIVMATLFGAAFGFAYTVWHGLGSLLVLAGLFWASSSLDGLTHRRKWILFVSAMFALHVALLVIYQWRALLVTLPTSATSLFPSNAIQSQWFTPVMYLGAALVQFVFYLRTEARMPNVQEWLYGIGGGVTNSLCTIFLLQGTEVASGLERIVLFPFFSIGILVLSNWWGQRLYRETVNWRACQICALGLFIGTVDWTSLLKF